MILYKKDSKGKIRTLNIYAKDGYLHQSSGLEDGKKVNRKKLCAPKNVGKKNETTSVMQAFNESTALVEKKLSEGYFITSHEAKNSNVILPMLAKDFNKEEHKIKYPCFIQPKLDGMRCLTVKSEFDKAYLISRKNKVIDTLPHISKLLEDPSWPYDYNIDGELYAHGLTFQENIKLIKKNRPESFLIKFHIYDYIWKKNFEFRNSEIKQFFEQENFFKHIVIVPTYKVKNREEIDKYYEKFMSEGYEGAIIRHGDKPYGVNKRCDSLLKLKEFKDIALPIVDITPAKADPTHGVPWFIYNGIKTKAGLKMSHADRKDLLTNKANYIGETAEVRYFELTDKGGLRFPVMHGFRLDK